MQPQPYPVPRKRRSGPPTALLGLLGMLVIAGICFIGAVVVMDGGDDKPAKSSGTTAPAIDSGLPPVPDAATQAAYLADLRKIDPDIVGDKDPRTIVNRGRDQCSSIKQWPNDRAKLIDLANKRFTAPDHPDGFGAKTAARILDVVHKRICPTW